MPPGEGSDMPRQVGQRPQGRIALDADLEANVGKELAAGVPQPGQEQEEHSQLGPQPTHQFADGPPGPHPAEQHIEVERQDQEGRIVSRIECRCGCQDIPEPSPALPMPILRGPLDREGKRCHPEQRDQPIHAHFLGIVDVKRGDCQQNSCQDPTSMSRKLPHRSIQQGYRRRAQQHR